MTPSNQKKVAQVVLISTRHRAEVGPAFSAGATSSRTLPMKGWLKYIGGFHTLFNKLSYSHGFCTRVVNSPVSRQPIVVFQSDLIYRIRMKRRVGRPATGNKPRLSIRMEPAALRLAGERAKSEGKTVGLWLEEAIRDKLERESDHG